MFDGIALPGLRTGAPTRLELDPLDPINQGLVGFWPLNEPGGNVARDISPYRSHGTFQDAGGTVSAPARTVGKVGRVTTFAFAGGGNTPDAKIGTPAQIKGLQYPLTMAAWIKPANTSGTKAIFAQYGGTTGGQLVKLLRMQNADLYYYTTDASGGYSYVSTYALTASVWQFVAVTVAESRAVVIQINGVPTDLTLSSTFYASPDTTVPFWIGGGGAGYEVFDGQIALARMWARVLPKSALRRLHREPLAGAIAPEDRLLIGWRQSAGGTTYSDSLTETLTLADTLANVLTALASASAAATVADTVANTMTMPATASGAVTAADSLANALTALASASGSVTAGDAVANTLAMSASASDGATLGDGSTGGLLLPASVSDGLTLSDGLAQALTAAVAAAGAVTVADALATVLAATGAVADAAALSDTVLAVLAMLASVSDATSLADHVATGGTVESWIEMVRLASRSWAVTLPRRSWTVRLPPRTWIIQTREGERMAYTPRRIGLDGKHPAESGRVGVNFVDQLAASDSLASITGVTPSAGITVSGQSISGTSVVFRLSGGTHGATYEIEVVVVTTGGDTLVADLEIAVTDPTP